MKQDIDTMIDVPQGYQAILFSWDRKFCSEKIQLQEDGLRCITRQGSGFKTVLGNQRFQQGGRYYYEVFINKGQLFKIGISRPHIENLNEAFCDTKDGWAIYNGQTRHNSNSTGPKYGVKLAAGDIVGVALDMIAGKLSYYKNGQYWGVAFNDDELKKGDFVAAVSPIYVNDIFTLRNMIKED